ncbi:MAG: tRNA uridine-5-carboxymethylaminomethyl(34) synthesis GTPase MnmE, partial [Sphingomonas sp.]
MTTIFAVSSGRPPAAIAVVRISGSEAFAAAIALAGPLPAARHASLRALRDASGTMLDRALVIVFPGPTTATGEDLVELHCHGGRAVIAAVERTLAAMTGLRVAEPGEFTRRALGNGRIDLTQAEGLADLLEAETEAQRVAAITATEGRVSQAVRGWMDAVAMLSARIEA